MMNLNCEGAHSPFGIRFRLRFSGSVLIFRYLPPWTLRGASPSFDSDLESAQCLSDSYRRSRQSWAGPRRPHKVSNRTPRRALRARARPECRRPRLRQNAHYAQRSALADLCLSLHPGTPDLNAQRHHRYRQILHEYPDSGRRRGGRFEFQKGPIFTNLLLADENHRTPPRRRPRFAGECRATCPVPQAH